MQFFWWRSVQDMAAAERGVIDRAMMLVELLTGQTPPSPPNNGTHEGAEDNNAQRADSSTWNELSTDAALSIASPPVSAGKVSGLWCAPSS
jgi:hypothetical protein